MEFLAQSDDAENKQEYKLAKFTKWAEQGRKDDCNEIEECGKEKVTTGKVRSPSEEVTWKWDHGQV